MVDAQDKSFNFETTLKQTGSIAKNASHARTQVDAPRRGGGLLATRRLMRVLDGAYAAPPVEHDAAMDLDLGREAEQAEVEPRPFF